jgi:hypothetical protein
VRAPSLAVPVVRAPSLALPVVRAPSLALAVPVVEAQMLLVRTAMWARALLSVPASAVARRLRRPAQSARLRHAWRKNKRPPR